MKLFVCAGEVSGDAILAQILARLRSLYPDLVLEGFGGEASARQGLVSRLPLDKMAFNGVWDVLGRAFFCLGMLRLARRSLARFGPDLVLLVDYPGLNLRLAALARKLAIPVYYVAPPQIWVYRKPGVRLAGLGRALGGATLHVVFPFEAPPLRALGGRVVIGHFLAPPATPPNPGFQTPGLVSGTPGSELTQRHLLCLCPGSRRPVLRRNLPAWLAALAEAGILARTDSRDARTGSRDAGSQGNLELKVLVPAHLQEETLGLVRGFSVEVTCDKRAVLAQSRWAIAFPGTITLELALQGIPMLVLALVDALTLAVGKRALASGRLGLPSLLLGETIFPEWVGPPGAFHAGDLLPLWERLRDGVWDFPKLLPRWQNAIGPGSGADLAAGECLRILEKTVTKDTIKA